jgi:hypothetical protein
MPLTQLAPPYPIFTDKNGDPLDAGFIYFGEPNQNPETSPITVYYDRGFTQPVAQPVRTSNGYIMRNGSPALIYADSNSFSVTVRNKSSELIIYSPTGYGVTPGIPFAVFDNAAKDVADLLADTHFTYNTGIIGTVQVSPGDILRTLAEGFAYEVAASGAVDEDVTTAGGVKLYVQPSEGVYNVRAFGAVGDGVTDDTSAIQTAINSGAGSTVYFPNGTYIVSTSLTLPNYTTLKGENYRWDVLNPCVIKSSAPINIIEVTTPEVNGIIIDGLCFAGTSSRGINAVGFYAANWQILNCSFEQTLEYGLYGEFLGTRVDSCYFGVLFPGSTPYVGFQPVRYQWINSPFHMVNVNEIINTRIEYSTSTRAALEVQGGYGLLVESCIFQENTVAPTVVLFGGVNQCTFVNNYFEGNTGNDYIITHDNDNIGGRLFTGGNFSGNTILTTTQTIRAVVRVANYRIVFNNNTVLGDGNNYYITEDKFNLGTYDIRLAQAINNDFRATYAGDVGDVVGGSLQSGSVAQKGSFEIDSSIGTVDAAAFNAQLKGNNSFAGVILQMQNDDIATATPAKVTGRIEMFNGPNLEHFVSGSTVGPIILGANGVDVVAAYDTYFRPQIDDALTLGTPAQRWTTVYATSPTINTSDANEKQQIEDVTEAERRVASVIKGMIKRFKFNEAVAKKGDNARIHFGVIAQDVKSAFEAEGLDAHAYGIFCSDTWWEDADGNIYNEAERYDVEGDLIEQTRLGVRYEELLALVISAI